MYLSSRQSKAPRNINMSEQITMRVWGQSPPCDSHYLVFALQMAGCQLIYPPSLTSAEEEMEQTVQNLFPLIP